MLVYLLAGRHGGTLSLILAGVAINAFALALVSLLLNLAPSPYAVQEIALWDARLPVDTSMNEFWIMLPGTLLGWLLLLRLGQPLDLLSLGEETSRSRASTCHSYAGASFSQWPWRSARRFR